MENKIFSDKYRLGLPKAPIGERVVGERGRNDLPPGTKGGEIMTPERPQSIARRTHQYGPG